MRTKRRHLAAVSLRLRIVRDHDLATVSIYAVSGPGAHDVACDKRVFRSATDYRIQPCSRAASSRNSSGDPSHCRFTPIRLNQ